MTTIHERGNLRESIRPYEFTDQSERQRRETLDITAFEESAELGRGIDVNVLVKWTNQMYHDDNLRAMFTPDWDPIAGISRKNSWRHRNQYYSGLVVQANLDADHIDSASARHVTPASQPTCIDKRSDGLTAFACADKILLSPDGNLLNSIRTIDHPAFARLHSVEFSEDGQRLLTASSSLDLLHEVDLDGNIIWSFDAWQDSIFNINKLGQAFYRDAAKAPTGEIIHNPNPLRLKDDENLRDAVCVLDNPALYDSLGLPTNLTPVFMNTASYGPNGSILTTSFHRGEAWIINPATRRVTVAAKGMGSPHGLHVNANGRAFMVTDTLNEQVRLIPEGLQAETIIDLSGLGERKPGLENSRWLQYTTCLGENLYCAIMASRQRITLFDPVRRVRRDISFDSNWGIQMVTTFKYNKSKSARVSAAIGNIVTANNDINRGQ